jgi:hypothetical protein
MEKESSNILAVYDWFEVVCSGEPETTNSVEDTKDIYSVSHQCWFSKTLEQRERLFQKLLNDHTPLVLGYRILFSIRNPYINRYINHFSIHS